MQEENPLRTSSQEEEERSFEELVWAPTAEITVRDIFSLKLQSPFVSLIACESAQQELAAPRERTIRIGNGVSICRSHISPWNIVEDIQC